MPRPTSSDARNAGPSQRQLRVAELIRRAIADVLVRGEIIDDVITRNVISIPEVRLSPDLKNATVYVMPLGGKDGQLVIKALAENAKFLRGVLARRVEMKFMPMLRFRLDETFEYAGKVDTLLRTPEVARDLENPLPSIDDDTDEP